MTQSFSILWACKEISEQSLFSSIIAGIEHHHFDTWAQFMKWRCQVEENTKTNFVQRTQMKTDCHDGEFEQIFSQFAPVIGYWTVQDIVKWYLVEVILQSKFPSNSKESKSFSGTTTFKFMLAAFIFIPSGHLYYFICARSGVSQAAKKAIKKNWTALSCAHASSSQQKWRGCYVQCYTQWSWFWLAALPVDSWNKRDHYAEGVGRYPTWAHHCW